MGRFLLLLLRRAWDRVAPRTPRAVQRLQRFVIALALATLLYAGLKYDFGQTRYHNADLNLDLYAGVVAEVARAAPQQGTHISALTSRGLADIFTQLNYRLKDIETHAAPVPAYYVQQLPHDLARLSPVERKRLFLKIMLPLVVESNAQIAAERARLMDLRSRPFGLWHDNERAWLDDVRVRYEVKDLSPASLDELVRRVDEVPVALALAQAIEESGWGTSRFARDGNNVYGQVYDPAAGAATPLSSAAMLFSAPALRAEDSPDHSPRTVATFASLYDSVASYMRNLNTHRAYENFRRAREQKRQDFDTPDTLAVLPTLTGYSVRGEDYITALSNLLTNNNLYVYDGVRKK